MPDLPAPNGRRGGACLQTTERQRSHAVTKVDFDLVDEAAR